MQQKTTLLGSDIAWDGVLAFLSCTSNGAGHIVRMPRFYINIKNILGHFSQRPCAGTSLSSDFHPFHHTVRDGAMDVRDGARWCEMVRDGAMDVRDGARWCEMVRDGARWCEMVRWMCEMVRDGAR